MSDIVINNSNVVINTHHQNLQQKKRYFKKMWKIGGWRLYLTHNFRLRNSQTRDNERHLFDIIPIKEKMWGSTKGHCMMCGKEIGKFCHSQVHHILPYSRFPHLATNEINIVLLCRTCHEAIHTNPFLDSKLQTEKAKELGINLKDYYDV
jgi:predicted HNH restriction endonuclease